MNGKVSDTFSAFGHVNVTATHHSTLEFTKEKHLSRTGDCILAVCSEKALTDLSNEFKDSIRKPNAKLTVTIEANGTSEQINAHGSPKLLFTHHTDMVLRKSSYIDSRTLGIQADKAARDLSRTIVEKLKNPEQKVIVTLTIHF